MHEFRASALCEVSVLVDPPHQSQRWPVTSLPADTALCVRRWASVSFNLHPLPSHVAAAKADTNTQHSIHAAFDLCFVLCFQQAFKLVWMCYINVSERRPEAAVQGEETENMGCKYSSGLSLTSLPPLSSPSLLHQLIQAWSDTWASRVSVAIKMPPLQRFNWNFCCWCVNSCRTEKGRSIIPALHRPPEVKWQQLLWQENPQSACLFMILLLHPSLCTALLSHLHIPVWLWNDWAWESESIWKSMGLGSSEMTSKDVFLDSLRGFTHSH